MIFDQEEFNLRCEWGAKGVSELAPISDLVVIVDVLSFSTSTEIATNNGAIIYPYQWRDESALDYAQSVQAELSKAPYSAILRSYYRFSHKSTDQYHITIYLL
jgi:2-phosphosulfolactate phosphatase